MADHPVRVLVVDDDEDQLDLIARLLRHERFEVRTTSEAIGFSNLVRSFAPDLVLLDVEIPALTGDRLLSLSRKVAPAGTKFVLFSACDEEKLRRLAIQVEADGWASKSWEPVRLLRTIHRLCPRAAAAH
jgi:DNA-binding response OmpR family regulator